MTEFETPETVTPDEDAPLPRPSLGELSVVGIVLTIVLILDQFTKYLVEAHLPLYTNWVPFPRLAHYFQIIHATNTGAAFGLFPDGSIFFMIVAVAVAAVILYYNYTLPAGQRLLRIALGLQLAGALGNFIDRMRIGHVTDFIDIDISSIIYIPYISDWPVFNVADMSIVSGVIIMAWLMWREYRHMQATTPSSETPHERSLDESEFRAPADEWASR
ncbi:MAG: signal peptidase II [Chloroflexota bacterium]|nr:signal peptidase II [Anaerolineales bacterium]